MTIICILELICCGRPCRSAAFLSGAERRGSRPRRPAPFLPFFDLERGGEKNVMKWGEEKLSEKNSSTKWRNNSTRRGSRVISTMNEHGIIGDKQAKWRICAAASARALDTRPATGG